MNLDAVLEEYSVELPCFIYDLDAVERRINKIIGGVPNNVVCFYSMKANNNSVIVGLMRKKDVGIEIASLGEFTHAIKMGHSAKKMIFTGPGKRKRDLDPVVKSNIRLVNVESLHECEVLNEIARKYNTSQDILVRISPSYKTSSRESKNGYGFFGGAPAKFGIDQEEVLQAIPIIKKFKHLNFKGIHVFAVSGVLDYQEIILHIKQVFKIVSEIEHKLNVRTPIIDFGGGLGVSYTSSYEFDFQAFCAELKKLVKEYGFEDRELIFELGTYFVAESGNYLCEVVDVKKSRGKTFLIADGGINHILRTAMVGNHKINIVSGPEKTDYKKFEVVGNLCHPLDILGRGIELPDLGSIRKYVGRLLCIRNCGAYAQNFAVNSFSMHDLPSTYVFSKGSLKKVDIK